MQIQNLSFTGYYFNGENNLSKKTNKLIKKGCNLMKQAYEDLYEAQTIKRGNYKLKNINKVSEDKIEPILTAKVDGYNTTLCRTAYGRDSFELSTYKNGQLKERLTSTGEGIIDKYYRPDMNLAEGDYRIMNKNDKELKKAEKFIQKFLSVFVK